MSKWMRCNVLTDSFRIVGQFDTRDLHRRFEVDMLNRLNEMNASEWLSDLKELNQIMSNTYEIHHAELIQVRILLFRMYIKLNVSLCVQNYGNRNWLLLWSSESILKTRSGKWKAFHRNILDSFGFVS